MRSYFFLLLCFFVFSASAQQTSSRKVKQYTIEQFYKTVSYGGGAFSADDKKILIHNNSTGIFNVYELNLATGAQKPLTHSNKESFFAIDYVPHTQDFLYTADKGGNENDHIYLQAPSGTVKDLTPGAKEKAGFVGWNKDRTAFYYTSNVRDPKFFDVYKMNVADWKSEPFYKNEQGLDVGAISRSEQYLLLTKSITTDKNELYLLNRSTNELKKISSDTAEALYQPQDFDRDNSAFYYTTNEGTEFTHVVKYDLASGEKQTLFSADWDVMYMYLSQNGKYHVIGINEDGRNKTRLFDHQSGKELSFPTVSDGSVSGVNISPDEKDMIVYVMSDRSPMNLWHYNFASGALKKLTNALNPEINPDDLVSAEVVRFKSFDSLEIPAIFYKPHTASQTSKVPAVLWIHGGPGGQTRAGYSQMIQYLVNHGYAVLGINNRGSSGYGKTFFKMDNQDHGDRDLKDCVWGKKWLAQQSYVASDKIGIIGGSYGGFMSLAAIIQYPQEFAASIDMFGVTNWLRTLRSVPPYWESFRKALYTEMGDPNTGDSVRLKSISPLYNTDKIHTPLLVFQGVNDPRVLKIESDEIVAGAKKNGAPVEYVLFPDEGHGFAKKENQMKTARVSLEFLDKYVKNKPQAQATKDF